VRKGHLIGLACVLTAASARASNVSEFPDNGSEQLGRGGAWVARASDPVAAFYNPAGLAGQRTKLTAQLNLVHQETCFARAPVASDTTLDKLNGTFPKVCSTEPFTLPPNPVFALAYRVSPKLGIAAAFLTPSYVPSSNWPEQVSGLPSPQRYMMLKRGSLFMMPTLAIGYEALPGLRLGASFTWGIASMSYAFAGVASSSTGANPLTNDVRMQVDAIDPFVPGGTLGALYSAGDNVDFGAWFKFSKPIQATGDLRTTTSSGITGKRTPGNVPECKGGAVKLQMPVPIELKLGARFHKSIGHYEGLRDPMLQDVWDVEVNFTWVHDGDFNALQMRLPPYDDGGGVLPLNGLMGARIPANADMARGYRDVLGLRLGGDYNLVPGTLAVRAGTFFETAAQDARFQSIDNMGGARIGFSAGGTWRISSKASWRAFELSLGYMHMIVLNQANGTPNGNPAFSIAGPNYRTPWPVNIGTISSSLDVINLGLSYRF
jgi:long-chain fatty acid transport protein